MTRICLTCKEAKPLDVDHFYRERRLPTGLKAVCRVCQLDYNRKYKAALVEKHGRNPYYDTDKSRANRLMKKYGLKPKDIPDVCDLCDTKGRNRRQEICVDHCHETGRVRGFLCHDCNIAIGKVGDDANLLRRMADYLEKT